MYAIVGFIVGLIIQRLVLAPIERRKAREWCIKHGLVREGEEE